MEFDILTLFPQMFDAPLGDSIIGRAQSKKLITVRCHQIRDFTTNRQNQVDDYPYGGGSGCVMQAQPLYDCWKHANSLGGPARTIYLSPRGKTFTQADAVRLAADYDRLILICGHYEGVDQRLIDAVVDEEISLGDFVLTGGEIPAMALADAVARLIPGVLADTVCFTEESHWSGLLEYPHYSRPEIWEGRRVPDVLQSGDHGAVERWRKKQSFLITLQKRPDMFARLLFTKADLKLLGELRDEADDPAVRNALARLHTGRITVRRTTKRDLKGFETMYQTLGLSPAAAIDHITTLDAEGITCFSIYADDHGFCGHCAYDVDGDTAFLRPTILPHARDKGIDTFAVAHVLDHLFAGTATKTCVISDDLPSDVAQRLGVVRTANESYILAKKNWRK